MDITKYSQRIKCHIAHRVVYLDRGCYQTQLADKVGELMLVSMVLNKQHEYYTTTIVPMVKQLKGVKTERSRQLRRHAKYWGEAYHLLNMNWFNLWNDEIKALICDSMDDFEEKTRNGVVRCRIAYRNMLRKVVPAEYLTTTVNLILCAEFVAVAARKWEDVYRCPENPIVVEQNFTKLINSIIHFSQVYYYLPEQILIDSDALENVKEEERTLGMQLAEWIQDPNGVFFSNFCKAL